MNPSSRGKLILVLYFKSCHTPLLTVDILESKYKFIPALPKSTMIMLPESRSWHLTSANAGARSQAPRLISGSFELQSERSCPWVLLRIAHTPGRGRAQGAQSPHKE